MIAFGFRSVDMNLCIFVSLRLCLPAVCLSVCLSVSQFPTLSLSLSLFVCLAVAVSVSLSLCLRLCLPPSLSLCFSVCLSVCLSLCLSLSGFVSHVSGSGSRCSPPPPPPPPPSLSRSRLCIPDGQHITKTPSFYAFRQFKNHMNFIYERSPGDENQREDRNPLRFVSPFLLKSEHTPHHLPCFIVH